MIFLLLVEVHFVTETDKLVERICFHTMEYTCNMKGTEINFVDY